MKEVIKSYKGFNSDMTCTPTSDITFQYEEGKEYETDKADVCNLGFHACRYQLDVLSYYSPDKSVYHKVEQSGEISTAGYDSKISSTKIKIGASINIAGLVKDAIEYTTKRTNKESDSTGDYGASSATGNCSASSATGYKGASSAYWRLWCFISYWQL